MFTLDPKTTALVLIDLQLGIVSRPGAGPHSAADVVKQCVSLARAFRIQGSPVVLVHVDVNQIQSLTVDEPMRPPGSSPVPAQAMEFVPEIGPEPSDIVIVKHQWRAFSGTALDQQLRRRGVKTIVLGGVATNFGVESTARNANEFGYEQVFVEDGMTSVSVDAHRFSIQHILPRLGRVRSVAEVLAAFGA
jgi:nicotinamidase-related amidase